ncbi:MAG: hypothetical protein KC431_10045, partial [Myxococcales bacterium]|nr:hypothetical protein [Myxococcales bacterium]
IPPEGASAVSQIGEGSDARIGSATRVPGPAGKGKDGTMFLVLSSHTLGSTQKDMSTALQEALANGGLARLNWILVGGLLVISLVLTFYLPHLEFNTPLRRLTGEFANIIEGKQHELFHDTYGGGDIGKLARAAQTTMEALRVSWESDVAMDDGEDAGDTGPRRTRSTRSLRASRTQPRKRTRGHQSVTDGEIPADADGADDDPEAIELPSIKPAGIERHAAAEGKPKSRKGAPPPTPAPAPAFSDEVSAASSLPDDDSVSLGLDVGGDIGGGGADDRESYYRKIFNEFVETKVACGEPTEGFTYEKFAKKLRKQSDSLLGRDDVKDVEFSVYVKDG